MERLCAMHIETPELQRAVDDDRVQDIVTFQIARLDAGLSPLFIGDVTLAEQGTNSANATCGGDEPPRFWLVDGQHRMAAMRRLLGQSRDVVRHHKVGVTVLHLSASLSLATAFQMINRAVPVPQYIVDGTLNAARRMALDHFGRLFTSQFRVFLSSAALPRRPHINLAQLQDRIHDSSHLLDAFMSDASEMLVYVLWCNNALRDHDHTNRERADAKAGKAGPGSVALYLRSDDSFAWLEDRRWLQAFKDGLEGPPAMTALMPPRSTGGGSVPAALRFAVWNRDIGARVAIGACGCCGQEISMQAFEAGHVVAVARGGQTTLDNLRSICALCNRSMGARNMDEFISAHFGAPVPSQLL